MSTAQKIITENIDLWTSAIKAKKTQGRGSSKKRELYGIKKLRELILELAVRGKLAPQDSSDEPASALLEKIAVEKSQLIKDKKIKNSKPLSKITNKEKPFNLPNGWEWVRLGSVGVGSTGKTPSTKESSNFDGDIPFLGPGQITPGGELLQPEKFLSEEGVVNSTEAKSGDILMVCIGGSIGKSAICNGRIAFNQQINAISPIHITSSFLHFAVSSNRFYQSILDKSTGSATPIINRSKWEELLVPICPGQEQHRIVAKVDELMALCDQLEQQTESSLDAHKLLVDTLLSTLTDACEASELSDNWARLADHFDTLITTDYAVEQLKQTILQLAVMGKLVPQDPSDEPAIELLKRIAAVKEQLVKDKKIKKQKPLPLISEEEKPFELPVGWAWSRMRDLAQYQKGHAFKSKDYLECGLMITKIQNLTENHIQNSVYISPERALEFAQYLLYEGDIVMTTVGSWFSAPMSAVGRSFLINKLFDNSLLNQNAVRIRSWKELEAMYLFACINSPIFNGYLVQEAQGTANQASITQESIKNFLLCVPPKEEQRRIVKTVDQLMTLCDQIKARLNEAQTTQLQLTDTVVEGALNQGVCHA